MTILNIIGFTLDLIGKGLLALSVYFVHNRIVKEKKVDKIVLKEMRMERNLAFIGLILMIVGYLMQLPTKIYE